MGRRIRGCRVQGPLAPWQAGFEGWLLGRGYEHAFLAEYWEAETELTRRRGSAGREHTDLRRAMSA